MTELNPLRDPDDRRLARVAGPCAIVIFGATGDLARKKLLPALYDLTSRGLLPPGFAVVGVARSDGTDRPFDDFVLDAVKQGARTPFSTDVWETLQAGIRFVPGDLFEPGTYTELGKVLAEVSRTRVSSDNVAFYLSIPPSMFPTVCDHLTTSGLATSPSGWRRVVVEKPFGHDLQSARELNDVVSSAFPDDAVFRVDHYLGKETVQNIMALRFANELFEPLWNSHHVDHVQITMAEDIGIGGRAGYYDGVGAARDVIQNHLLQLLALTAMEEPLSFSAADLRAEKQKVLAAVHHPSSLTHSALRGQYTAGWQGSTQVVGYCDEPGIPADSATETYAALKLLIDTRRWAGVPFYVRTGKRLGRRVTEIAVTFKSAPHHPFDRLHMSALSNNALVLRIQPDEGTTLRFGSKVPGSILDVRDVTMDFAYGESFTQDSPEAYERLIVDVLLGDPPLFPQHEEVELSWRILDPVTKHWADRGVPDRYRAGTWGPASADVLLARDGRSWRRP